MSIKFWEFLSAEKLLTLSRRTLFHGVRLVYFIVRMVCELFLINTVTSDANILCRCRCLGGTLNLEARPVEIGCRVAQSICTEFSRELLLQILSLNCKGNYTSLSNGPCRTLASFRISFKASLSLAIFVQPLTPIFFTAFSTSSNHPFLGLPTDIFHSEVLLTTFFTVLSSGINYTSS